MIDKKVELGNEAREKLLKGINTMYSAVSCTLGPMGKNVLIKRSNISPVHITKDGVTVARDISLKDAIEDLGVQVVKEAAMKTAEKAGDGTTTATVLAANIISKGIGHVKNGSNSVHLKKGIEMGAEIAIKYIAERAKKIESPEELNSIASISANNDAEIGALVAEGMSKVGEEGTVAVETSKTGLTSIEVVEGLKIDRGYVSPYFCTDAEKMQAILIDPYILCADMPLSNMQELVPILEMVAKSGQSIVVIANEIEGDALAAMILNKVKGMLNIVAIKTPQYGEIGKEILRDISAVCAGTMASPEIGLEINGIKLGKASKVIVTKDSTTIIGGAGKTQDIQIRIAQARSQMEGAKYDHEKNLHKMRLARLTGGVAIMYVGAASEIEMKEKKDRVDDALAATKAALEEGVVPGGGIIYAQAADVIGGYIKNAPVTMHEDIVIGMKIMQKALHMPFNVIMQNAGWNSEVISQKIIEKGELEYGYDAKNDKYGNMLELGIIDPAKVARVAIEIASSIACTFITTECVIAPEKIDLNNLNTIPPMGR